jgi:CcmD family protein
MSTAEQYVTGAYCVVFALVLIYVVIIALKLQRLEREVSALEPVQPEVLTPEREKVEAGVDG